MPEHYVTLRDIMRRYQQPRHVVTYAIDRYGPEPCGRVGIARIWRAEDVPAIEDAIRKTHGEVEAAR